MKLTRYTDYALRVLIHLGAHEGEIASIGQIARLYGISQNHLMKVVQDLGRTGFVETVRGRNGGLRLGRPAAEINLGQLVRHTEGGFDLVDCDDCLIAPACSLPKLLAEATRAFLAVLDKYSLADLVARPADLRALFDSAPLPAGAALA
ncbi:Rrf2 family transcriptional regulator [Sphingomonas oleivorans]|uniref:Rrf2 family transcriptional regulator n=1 Tax=Sphingomonas oleivorans TaxID=1735121 RepID=A0A2T5FZL1_9SPHN|nr:Rrf2 family transcriptional regulator [Sphingomonas oleivorans]PTQ12140.1 Rrf2 family transcriptional regulator [Sphingomonas oleivorans]